ncbi:hypothetical protein VNO78_00185 [Psophocarpus tetragonolobus]|uniref:Uncharacterized protein n=1 Tax=Psophocarpus tetragonolobus TaxID=3891 RepID=A0AAN9XTX6_PSOTE
MFVSSMNWIFVEKQLFSTQKTYNQFSTGSSATIHLSPSLKTFSATTPLFTPSISRRFRFDQQHIHDVARVVVFSTLQVVFVVARAMAKVTTIAPPLAVFWEEPEKRSSKVTDRLLKAVKRRRRWWKPIKNARQPLLSHIPSLFSTYPPHLKQAPFATLAALINSALVAIFHIKL